MEKNGVWRTIKGRHIFIEDGQSLSDALKKNGLQTKKKSKEEDEYELYKRAKENPDSIDPMTENSTDWEVLEKKYKDKYFKEVGGETPDRYSVKDNQISRISPYDETEYAFAQVQNDGSWNVYYKEGGKQKHIQEANKQDAFNRTRDINRHIRSGETVTSYEGIHKAYPPTEDYISKKEFKEATKIDDALDRAIMMQAADDVGKTLNDDDIRFRAEHYIRHNYNGNATDDEIFEKLRNEYKNRGWYEPTPHFKEGQRVLYNGRETTVLQVKHDPRYGVEYLVRGDEGNIWTDRVKQVEKLTDEREIARRIRTNKLRQEPSTFDDLKIYNTGAEKEGYYVQFQDTSTKVHEDINKYPHVSPKVKSNTWARVWKDGENIYNQEGLSKYEAREKVANFLETRNSKSISEMYRYFLKRGYSYKTAMKMANKYFNERKGK